MNVHEIDHAIKSIRETLDYQVYLTPVNFQEENEKFLEYYKAGKVYNPQYRYKTFLQSDNDEIISQITRELQDSKSGMEKVLSESVTSLSNEIIMYRSIGDNSAFTENAVRVHGKPDCDLLQSALSVLLDQSTVGSDANEVTAETLAAAIKERLDAYGFSWNVVLLDNMASRISVEPDQHTVYINRNKKFTLKDKTRLLVHEIDTHVLRSENGSRRGFEVLSGGTAGSLIHEEGLALYNEWANGVQDNATIRLYAARFIACCKIHLSFYELFDMLVNYGCSTEQTMYVVSRIKRGISDTSLPGGFIKDYVYYQGFQEVKEFLLCHPEMYEKMYYGSISIGDIEVLKNEIDNELIHQGILLPIQKR